MGDRHVIGSEQKTGSASFFGSRVSPLRVGDAFDNALMKTINGLFTRPSIRTTVFDHGAYESFADVE